jgi:DUF4097 and DUF4098 domain-containing protein YvlB
MLRLAHSSRAALVALSAALALGQPVERRGAFWERVIYGNAPASTRLRILAHGPVTLQAGAGPQITYSVRVSVRARTENEARQVMQHYAVRVERGGGGWLILNAPAGPVVTNVIVKTPRLESAAISTSDGVVDASGVDGPLTVDTGGGELNIDRIQGDCKLYTVGGDVRIGAIGGKLQCSTGAGRIGVRSVKGQATLETVGGDIQVDEVLGPLQCQTGGGGIHVIRAGASVNAGTRGGPIIVEHAAGIVSARNMAGPVQVGAAPGIQCESASGGVRLDNIAGAMRVTTSLGNILAAILGGKLEDSFLATGNGDITVIIPSNVGVNIRAQNDLADSLRRISTDFRTVTVRRQGHQLVGEGPVNGGGPLLQISASAGNIFIKKQ